MLHSDKISFLYRNRYFFMEIFFSFCFYTSFVWLLFPTTLLVEPEKSGVKDRFLKIISYKVQAGWNPWLVGPLPVFKSLLSGILLQGKSQEVFHKSAFQHPNQQEWRMVSGGDFPENTYTTSTHTLLARTESCDHSWL